MATFRSDEVQLLSEAAAPMIGRFIDYNKFPITTREVFELFVDEQDQDTIKRANDILDTTYVPYQMKELCRDGHPFLWMRTSIYLPRYSKDRIAHTAPSELALRYLDWIAAAKPFLRVQSVIQSFAPVDRSTPEVEISAIKTYFPAIHLIAKVVAGRSGKMIRKKLDAKTKVSSYPDTSKFTGAEVRAASDAVTALTMLPEGNPSSALKPDEGNIVLNGATSGGKWSVTEQYLKAGYALHGVDYPAVATKPRTTTLDGLYGGDDE